MKFWITLICLMLYCGLWWNARAGVPWKDRYLSPPLPVPVYKMVSGYGEHMAGFSLFVRSAIFCGNRNVSSVDQRANAQIISLHFDAAAQLYPKFIDSYFFAQSFVAHISPDFARQVNLIHDRGIAALPEYLYIPFFKAYNLLRYLDDPLAASRIFEDLSRLPEAPRWFLSLSAKLKGRSGELVAGRGMLRIMYVEETNPEVRERYALEIDNFDKALGVQAAIDQFRHDRGRDPEELGELVPRYLPELPKLNLGAVFGWQASRLRLQYPVF